MDFHSFPMEEGTRGRIQRKEPKERTKGRNNRKEAEEGTRGRNQRKEPTEDTKRRDHRKAPQKDTRGRHQNRIFRVLQPFRAKTSIFIKLSQQSTLTALLEFMLLVLLLPLVPSSGSFLWFLSLVLSSGPFL